MGISIPLVSNSTEQVIPITRVYVRKYHKGWGKYHKGGGGGGGGGGKTERDCLVCDNVPFKGVWA